MIYDFAKLLGCNRNFVAASDLSSGISAASSEDLKSNTSDNVEEKKENEPKLTNGKRVKDDFKIPLNTTSGLKMNAAEVVYFPYSSLFTWQ